MSYKIVKNAAGEVISFGPNDDMYEPTLHDGETLTIESDKVAEPLIKAFTDKLAAEAAAAEAAAAEAKAALLERLNITAEEAAILLG